MFKVIIVSTLFILGACASETAKMAHQVGKNFENEFNDADSDLCKMMLDKSENEDFIFNPAIKTFLEH